VSAHREQELREKEVKAAVAPLEHQVEQLQGALDAGAKVGSKPDKTCCFVPRSISAVSRVAAV
jgi:hypothetical protein